MGSIIRWNGKGKFLPSISSLIGFRTVEGFW